jgi:hypothetical protein
MKPLVHEGRNLHYEGVEAGADQDTQAEADASQ